MAQRDLRQMKCLLGVADEPITTHNRHLVTWRTSKIGGQPDWMNPNAVIPRCKICEKELLLVVQIYAPLEESDYHRTLYVYGCIGHGSSVTSECFRVLRSQCLDEESEDEERYKTISNSRMDAETTDWLSGADDWTFEDEDGGLSGGSPNLLPSCWKDDEMEHGTTFPDIINDEIYVSTVKLNQNETSDERKRVVITNYADVVLDEQGNARPVVVASKSIDNSLSENVRKLQLSDSAEGAVGISHDYDAEVEPPDEGTSIALDTPSMPSRDCIDALFGREGEGRSSSNVSSSPVFESCFLAVIEEPLRERTNLLNDHERELLATYQRQEGMNINELYRSQTKESCEGGGTLESYEKSFVKHGDRTFQKLQNRLGLCPEQLLRYCRNASGTPILMTSCKGEDLEPGKCQHCGSDMIFELQILPTAVNFMRIGGVHDPVLEFGTIVVYTCRESCWKDDDNCWQEEKIAVVADPDEVLFRALKSKRNV